jgi:hypothetical protein
MRRYTLTLDLQVTDPADLYEAARARLIEDNEKLVGALNFGTSDLKGIEEQLVSCLRNR